MTVRADYRLCPGGPRSMILDAPDRPRESGLAVALSGTRLPWRERPGEPAAVELSLPKRPQPAELMITYRLLPRQSSVLGRLILALPKPRSPYLCGPVEWRIEPPAARIVIDPRIGSPAGRMTPGAGATTLAGAEFADVPLLVPPRAVTALAVSLAILAAGLWAMTPPLPNRAVIWATTVAAAACLWPQPVIELAQVGLPGIVALFVVGAFRTLRRFRGVRRKISTFRPPGSVARSRSASGREPSTVDLPTPGDSPVSLA